MSNVNAIENNLGVIRHRLDMHEKKLEKCRNDIIVLMDKVQSEFGKDPNGQTIVLMLNNAMSNLAFADSSLYQLKMKTEQLKQKITK